MVVLLILMVLICSSLPVIGSLTVRQSLGSMAGRSLYVGGSGPGNFTRIQDAIDASVDGDNVYVYAGSYPEIIRINKSILLYGEGRENTVIGVNSTTLDIVSILAANVVFNGFTVCPGVISDMTGIAALGSGCLVQNNCVEFCDIGIIAGGYQAQVMNNIVKNCSFAVYVQPSSHITVESNNIQCRPWGSGICLYHAEYTRIQRNSIYGGSPGLFVGDSNRCLIKHNDFFNASEATFHDSFLTTWSGNYWNRSSLFPHMIHGTVMSFRYLRWVNIDWLPAKEPNTL
jgi:parallel beta-helix repeat protein